ncbi:hypothetical protein F2Q70_00011494 [Brassica cretica]|uniref:Uncharacterized protein n=1 Tax=Brassica cretica TaxID=69181 RepID=A0A8S9LXP2_BRACR|nr:hypothetical protein F2Q70_00011494 [Brassica cretica]
MMNEWRTQRKFDTGSTSAAPLPPPVNDGDPWLREREGEPIPLFSHFDNPNGHQRGPRGHLCGAGDGQHGHQPTRPIPSAGPLVHGHSASLQRQRGGEEGKRGYLDLLHPRHPLQSPSHDS